MLYQYRHYCRRTPWLIHSDPSWHLATVVERHWFPKWPFPLQRKQAASLARQSWRGWDVGNFLLRGRRRRRSGYYPNLCRIQKELCKGHRRVQDVQEHYLQMCMVWQAKPIGKWTHGTVHQWSTQAHKLLWDKDARLARGGNTGLGTLIKWRLTYFKSAGSSQDATRDPLRKGRNFVTCNC